MPLLHFYGLHCHRSWGGGGLNVKNKSLLSTRFNISTYSSKMTHRFYVNISRNTFLSPDVLSSFGKKKHLNTVCSCYFKSVIAKEIVTIASKTIVFLFLTAVLSIERILHICGF